MDVNIALKEALRYQSNRDFTSAKRIYDSILIQLPHQPDANHNLGVLAVSVGQPQKAIPLIQKAITINPLKVAYWESLISVQVHLLEFSGAHISLKRATEFGHQSERLNTLSGTLEKTDFREKFTIDQYVDFTNELRERGWFEDALSECEAIQRNAKSDVRIRDCTVRCHLAKGRIAMAQQILESTSQEGVFSDDLNLIRIKLLQSEINSAKSLLTGIALQDSDNAELLIIKATILRLESKFSEALVALDQIANETSQTNEFLINRALCYLAIGKNEQALDDLSRAFEFRPNNQAIWHQLLLLQNESGDYRGAMQLTLRMIFVDPQNKKLIESLIDVANLLGNESLEFILHIYGQLDKKVTPWEFSKFHYGRALQLSGNLEKALAVYEQTLLLNPKNHHALNNIGLIYKDRRENKFAIDYLTKAITEKPDFPPAYSNLGIALTQDRQLDRAIAVLKQGLSLSPDHPTMLMNLGIAQKRLGLFTQALKSMLQSLSVDSEAPEVHLNLATVFVDLADLNNAKKHLRIALDKKPNFVKALWNQCATAKSIQEVQQLTAQILKIDPGYAQALMYEAGFNAIADDYGKLIELRRTQLGDHAYIRSFEWYLALGYQSPIFFNRWDLFDYLATLTDVGRPFYEFGVWTGAAFQYLINTYQKGYGFDTFSGLPEDWHDEAEGSYSAQGIVPRIDGGEFIVGRFEDTLPSFFSKPRPAASLINFDADLYSATICALENCHPVIDEKTILVFDEFIMNTNWEQDEFKALEEFCQRHDYAYKVVAVSFYEKQVAVQLFKQ